MIKLNFLLESVFRANPGYLLAESGNLNRPEQEALAGLLKDPEIFGVFKPQDQATQTSYKLAYKEVALLFYFLQQPGSLPLYFKSTFDDDVNTTLAKLIMEGIFEIEHCGKYVSGTAAQDALYKKEIISHSNFSPGAVHHSSKAIQYALHLNNLDTRSIASRLYCYNTAPMMTQENNLFAKPADVENFLAIGKNDPFAWEISKYWNKHSPTEKYKWIAWNRKGNFKNYASGNEVYKIYISPVLTAFPEVFMKSVRVLNKSKAFSFKTGMDRHGLLRPDKFVVYFYSHADLMQAAALLKKELKGYQAQGVPFTAQLDDDGMLSWGIDPAGKDVLENFEGGS
ncbi:MAG TPA: hypothetical protein PLA68_02260, partial [Panacibacter sp.]|nr:hypothetical protein [Panacibacter sp.]